ncbi:uncharacterized protein LOC122253898 [Penaeus japonicus]|uniref:uncharacterized protein LOC122253898 n=1 Tax=Penaeus japonicus TaxID=27405 RepID=UPI001C716F38|nr:uncharacterized protein LOC122253898 [Penaeus japonicus]
MAPVEWTRSNTLAFIDLLRQQPCLWKAKCNEYKRRDLRSAGLEAIKAEMSRSMNCELDNEDIMKKIHTLKSQFHRELSSLRAFVRSGAGEEDAHKPKLWCFHQLSFLGEGDLKRPYTFTLDQEASQEHLAVLDDDMQFPPVHEHDRDSSDTLSRQSSAALNTPACSSKHLKRSKRSASVSQSDVLLSLIGERIATSSRLEDEFDCIGKNVAAKLRKMTPGMEVIAEKTYT